MTFEVLVRLTLHNVYATRKAIGVICKRSLSFP